MKKKNMIIYIVIVLMVIVVIQGIRISSLERDSYWQAAKKFCDVQSILKEIDEDWQMDSISRVTPYTYANPEGDIIIYYHCKTSYFTENEGELDEMNTDALGQVVDIQTLENRRECEVNGRAAIIGESDRKVYLCWTLDSENSCVIECAVDTYAEEDILHMAESVQLPEE